MSWVGNTILTASVLPHPNSERLAVFPIGGGADGAILVELVGTSGSGPGSLVSITSPLEGGAVKITGSVWVLNQSSGSTGGAVEISGVVPQYGDGVGYLPVTGSVGLDGPISITGALSATIVGPVTAAISNWPTPVTGLDVNITGSIPLFVSSTQQNPLWVTGSDLVVEIKNSTINISGSTTLSGVNVVSGALQVTGTVEVAGLTFSGTVSIPIEAYPNALENLQYTRKTQRFDLTSDLVNYIGYAVVGAMDAAAVWTIKRLSYDASGNLESTMWSSVSSAWSSRASEVYQ